MRYRINTPAVVHQTIDGETVIIHLDRGLYYSLDQVGAAVWGVIQSGATLQELTDQMKQRFAGAGIEAAVAAFVGELRKEDLVVEDKAARQDEGPAAAAADTFPVASSAFAPPVLHRYSDLQDLLVLDPIHQVDEAGWPDARPSPPPGTSR